MCTVLLPRGGNPIAVKYIILYITLALTLDPFWRAIFVLMHCGGTANLNFMIKSSYGCGYASTRYWTKVRMIRRDFLLFIWRNSPPPHPPVSYDLLIHEVSRSHTTTHYSPWDSSGRVISPSQRLLPDNTHYSRQTPMPPAGFEPTIQAGERPQTYALDRAATGTGD